ncbi:MAG: branched-chain amino acid ABC transporter substrate-binding protein [Betaproteobacteria bacterium]|nr:branched-chain amino acid ABC transporter substrate-binding protein [Betaproteobacteria bacterium]
MAALAAAAALACAATQAAPLKIALVETLSGPAAPTGQLFRISLRYSLDIINASGGWNGEPVQLMEYDNQGGPAGAADKVKAAIADGAHMIVQGAASSVAGQITEDVRKHNLRNPGKEVVFLNVGGEANEFVGEKCHYFHVRFSPYATLRMKALMGVMRAEKVMGDEVFAMNQNYSWGQDIEKATIEYGPSMGYKVVDKVLHDLNKVQDFSPYVAKIAASKADTVVTGNWGNDLLLLMKAAKSAGLKARFATTFLDQPGNIGNAGETALGHYVVHSFNAEAAGAAGEKYVNDIKAKTGQAPTFVMPHTINGMRLVGEALKATKAEAGNFSARAFIPALMAAKVSTPLGDISIRAADHQVILPMVVSVVSKDAKYKVDGTDMGFKPVKVMSGPEAAAAVFDSCKMTKPS